MAESPTGALKSSWNTLKAHWLLFLIFALVVMGWVVYYEITHPGEIRKKYEGLPLGVGDKFKNAKAGGSGA